MIKLTDLLAEFETLHVAATHPTPDGPSTLPAVSAEPAAPPVDAEALSVARTLAIASLTVVVAEAMITPRVQLESGVLLTRGINPLRVHEIYGLLEMSNADSVCAMVAADAEDPDPSVIAENIASAGAYLALALAVLHDAGPM